MKLVKSLVACFSTYSRIPMPVVDLDSDDMKYALVFLPVIGAVIGIIEYCIYIVAGLFVLPKMFRVLIMAVIPLIITGGIHIDGYMDTVDAFSSYSDREKKLAIMKDPHTGAFAVIYFAIYGLIFLAFSYLINDRSILSFCYSFVVARALSGIAAVTIKSAKSSGMLHDVKKNTSKNIVIISLFVILFIVFLTVLYSNVYVVILWLVSSVIIYFWYKRKMIKELDGITGDTSGYFMCIMELVLIVISSVGGLL